MYFLRSDEAHQDGVRRRLYICKKWKSIIYINRKVLQKLKGLNTKI